MGMNCHNTLRVIPLTIEEDAEDQLTEFWAAFTEEKEGSRYFTFEKLVPEPSGEFDSDWRLSHWGTTWLLEGIYDSESDKQQFVTKNVPPPEFIRSVSEKYPALVFFHEYEIPEDNRHGMGFFADGQFLTGRSGNILEENMAVESVMSKEGA